MTKQEYEELSQAFEEMRDKLLQSIERYEKEIIRIKNQYETT